MNADQCREGDGNTLTSSLFVKRSKRWGRCYLPRSEAASCWHPCSITQKLKSAQLSSAVVSSPNAFAHSPHKRGTGTRGSRPTHLQTFPFPSPWPDQQPASSTPTGHEAWRPALPASGCGALLERQGRVPREKCKSRGHHAWPT